MVVNKRKKVTKYRAHTTHGGGHRKKRRGAGSRGGRGRAGTGKRAGHKVHKRRDLGKSGFVPRRNKKPIKAVNLSFFTLDRLEKLVKTGKVIKENDFYIVDLKKLGYDKLLGAGKISVKLKLTASSYSNQAAEKVKAAGGVIISQEEEKKEDVQKVENESA